MDPKHENPPPYAETSGVSSPPPPGFVPTQQSYPYPVQQQPQPYPYPTQQYPNNYGQPTVVNVVPHPSHTQVLVVGACPTCRVGVLDDRATCAGICCCILFFPLGLICLFTMREKVCINCDARY